MPEIVPFVVSNSSPYWSYNVFSLVTAPPPFALPPLIFETAHFMPVVVTVALGVIFTFLPTSTSLSSVFEVSITGVGFATTVTTIFLDSFVKGFVVVTVNFVVTSFFVAVGVPVNVRSVPFSSVAANMPLVSLFGLIVVTRGFAPLILKTILLFASFTGRALPAGTVNVTADGTSALSLRMSQ